MNSRLLKAMLSALLVGVLALVFRYPSAMLSPGPLRSGHEALAEDCFACHRGWRGVPAQRCLDCHALADIGRTSTRGVALAPSAGRIAFHQDLQEGRCTACHVEHRGVGRAAAAPSFAHALLRQEVRDRCESCHRPPQDSLHRPPAPACGQCHATSHWRPATFDHDSLFLLDRDHDVACETCHVGRNFRRYQCTGCHEHSPAKLREEHDEEGIRNLDDCVSCHRSARGED